MILSILLLIGMLALMFKITGFIFGICGKLLGFVFSGIGYLFLGILAIGVLGMAFFVIPIILIVGVVSICTAILS